MGPCEIKIVGIAHHSPGDEIVYIDNNGELKHGKVYSIVVEQKQPRYINLYYNIMPGIIEPIPANRVWSNEKEYESHLKFNKATV